MSSKVYYGLSNVHFAFESDTSTPDAPKWDEPEHVPGGVSFSPEAQSEEYSFYADNIAYFSTHSDNGDAGDLEMAKFPNDILAKMQGWEVDANGGLLEITNGKKRNFALIFQIEGDENDRRFIYYNCSAGKPSTEYGTIEESIEVRPQTMPIIMLPLAIGERNIVRYSIERNETNATVYDNFFKSVYLPEGIVPANKILGGLD